MTATREIWVLGANGRCGSAVARELGAKQHSLVFVGGDASRLRELTEHAGGRFIIDEGA